MDCQTAREFWDDSHSCEPSGASDVQAHLAACPACQTLLESRRSFDDRVRAAMQDVPLPAGLRDRLLAALNHASPEAPQPAPAASSRETLSRRTWLRRVAYGAAAATVAVGAGLLWRAWPTPLATLDELRAQLGPYIDPRTGQVSLASLAEFQGDAVTFPRQFSVAGAPLKGLDLDGRPGHDAAVVAVQIGRAPSAQAILAAVPVGRLQAGDAVPQTPELAYHPAPHVVWREGEFVFVCMTAPANLPDLQRSARASVA